MKKAQKDCFNCFRNFYFTFSAKTFLISQLFEQPEHPEIPFFFTIIDL